MDSIRIENLEVYCHHGVLKEENVLGQKFLVSLVLYTDIRKAGTCDDLNYSIDYAEVSHFVERKMKEKNFQLMRLFMLELLQSQDLQCVISNFRHILSKSDILCLVS